MEAYPNPRWRDTNHHSNRLQSGYPPYNHHQPHSPTNDIPSPQSEHRHWQRNGPLGPGPWNRSDNWPPVLPPTRTGRPPPLLPHPSENGYMRMHRKEREFHREEHIPPHWSPEKRRDFPLNAATAAMRRIDGFQHDYNVSIRPRYSSQTSPHSFMMSRNNYDHPASFQFSDSSPLSQSPAYSDPTSSPDSRNWESPRGPRDESSPRDPRCRPSHYAHEESPRRRPDTAYYHHRSNTPPSRDPRHPYNRQSRIFHEKNRYSYKRDRSLDNGCLKSSDATSHSSSPTNKHKTPVMSQLNHKITVVKNHEAIKTDTLSNDCDEKSFDSPEVLKNILNRIIIEHSYARTEVKVNSLAEISSSKVNDCSTDASSLNDISKTEKIGKKDLPKCNEGIISVEMPHDNKSSSDESSPVSLTDYDLDFGTDSDGFSTSPTEDDTLIVSIPLDFSQICQGFDKSVPNTLDNDFQTDHGSIQKTEFSPLEKAGNSKILRKRTQRSLSKDDDSCSTTSSSSRVSQLKSKPFRDFVPEILETRSRAEAATVRRRQKMAKEIEQNEREREATAIDNEELNLRLSPSFQDDASSTASISSYQDSNSNKEEFSPDFIQRCKRTYSSRPFGSGDSILHKICRTGKLKEARYYILMEHHKVNIQDNAGWTPLHEACNNGFSEIAHVLLENGADPNLPAFDGSRPIHDAIEAGSFSTVRLLVEYGSDFMAEQGEKTPLELARSLNLIDIVEYLEKIIQDRIKRKNVKPKQILLSPVTEKTLVLSPSSDATLHSPVKLPFDGYKGYMFGPELDSPVIYISAIVEESETPFLPLYNIQVSHGKHPRKHNFHLLSDILKLLSVSREKLVSQLDVEIYTLTVGNFLQQLLNNPLARHSSIIKKLQELDITSTIELVPLCDSLRRLFNIKVANIDDY